MESSSNCLKEESLISISISTGEPVRKAVKPVGLTMSVRVGGGASLVAMRIVSVLRVK